MNQFGDTRDSVPVERHVPPTLTPLVEGHIAMGGSDIYDPTARQEEFLVAQYILSRRTQRVPISRVVEVEPTRLPATERSAPQLPPGHVAL